jgi:hypothetical protein
MERTPLPPGTVRGWEYVELDGPAIVPPPGTMPPPRPPGNERELTPQTNPEVAVLVARIESALEVIHAALTEIKRMQNPPQPQSKAS